ncbi:hypothetical protein A2Z00_02180 [Candidatus Gottesmanbacteria bacterium RBG_13_45_10]|uniref:AB hydrolase-1 domain-containing protein n=1 Tax=Candidatus Gottesmanbacteria bacterium RBG_13_45_10 TaxID=1798370 RepID=A0A1F5ZGL1_9BACT|nr:MAG: hypothetical protein A2Z00_02180 [Candidatus Gottesmanbacteria bacterium RBG_13_45_10]
MKKLPIVVLHGWGLSSERFQPLVRELNKAGYAVYAPNLPGFGDSRMPSRALNLQDYVEFLHTYLGDKRIKQPVLIGHSFGGRVSLKYEYMYPKSARALILTGVPGFTPVARKKLILFIAMAKLGKVIFSLRLLRGLKDKAQEWYYYLVGAKEYYRAKGAMRETFKNVVREDLLPYMKSVRTPCLLAWGESDIITPVSIAYRMKEVIKNAQLRVVSGVDHGLPYKHPELFVTTIKPFLETL